MLVRSSLVLFVLVLSVSVLHSASLDAINNAKVPAGFKAWRWATDLSSPRGIFILPTKDVLVIEKDSEQITLLFDADDDGVSNSTERVVIAQADGLNHGITYHEGYLYASSPTTVYRWAYDFSRTPISNPTVVIQGMPSGGHSSRTLIFDYNQYLYVGIGSASNVDSNSLRSRIMRYNLSIPIPNGGFSWTSGEVFVDGTRNENGFRIDRFGNMWGVENGCDNLARDDLGGDIHNTNPSEEINLLPSINAPALVNATAPGHFYGYPYCWSEGILDDPNSRGPGAQWAHPDFIDDGTHTDEWCMDTSNVVPPAFNLPAHTAPLDMQFYSTLSNIRSTFPRSYLDSAFVSLHGSWNRQPPRGYRVEHIQFNSTTHKPIASVPFFAFNGNGSDTGSGWNIRPVGLGMGDCGDVYGDCLLVSSDSSGEIIAVSYEAFPTPSQSSTGFDNGSNDDDRIDDLETNVRWVSTLTILLTVVVCIFLLAVIGFAAYKFVIFVKNSRASYSNV